ncbi:MAG: hypothetical protein DRP64_11095, partial [Verrucomicrobia bacterium]
MKKFLFSWVVVSVVLGFLGESSASTLYVDANSTTPVAPFSSWVTAATNIQNAVDASVAGDTVSVTNGHYLLSSEITVGKNIAIQSVHGSDVTIVDGGGTTRCFNLGNSACLISGFTIQNGYSSDSGGGIYCSDATPVVSNCTISGNSVTSSGGGMFRGTADNCTISGNSAWAGGGMRYGTANNCMISENSADWGGGMESSTANNCMISGNSASIGGGGMSLGTANDCTISGNSASGSGGGMYDGTANNCTIRDNTSDSWGGGIHGSTASNCEIMNN